MSGGPLYFHWGLKRQSARMRYCAGSCCSKGTGQVCTLLLALLRLGYLILLHLFVSPHALRYPAAAPQEAHAPIGIPIEAPKASGRPVRDRRCMQL